MDTTPQEIQYLEIENYSRLMRIKAAEGDHSNPVLDHEIKVSAAKLAVAGVDVQDLAF